MQEPRIVNIMDEINPNFYDFWLSEEPNKVLSGGRSSLKSSVISLKLVTDFLADPLGNIIVLRKVAKYLRKSVYEQIKWAIYKLGVEDEFHFGRSPLEIVHKPTGTAFYFYGVDDPQKLKSSIIAVGYVMAVWFEELAEFAGVVDIDTVEDTFIRADLGKNEDGSDKLVDVYYSYNPPKDEYHWVNQWADKLAGNPSYFRHHSDYEQDEKGFLSKQILKKIDNYKKNDPVYWRWMYKGEVVGRGDKVYNTNLMKPIDNLNELTKGDPISAIFIATDAGHQVSATTHLAIGITAKRNVVLLDTYYYSPDGAIDKKAPSELAEEFDEFVKNVRATYNKPIRVFTIDSAEGALRNQIWKSCRIRMNPVAKKSKLVMIDMVADLLAQGRFYYLNTENNAVFIEEHRKYQYDAKSKGNKKKVVEVDDHTCDAFQYFVVDNETILGINVRKDKEATTA